MAISCDPSALANAARCFSSCGTDQQALKTYLLDQLANSSASDPLAGLDNWGFFTFGNLDGITSITFNTALSIPGFDFEGNSELVSMFFPNLVSIDPTAIQGGYLLIEGCHNLTTLSMPMFLPNNGDTYALDDNALDAASVNGFLARCVANPAFVTGLVKLQGGTNAAPSGQGIIDGGILFARGVLVTTN